MLFDNHDMLRYGGVRDVAMKDWRRYSSTRNGDNLSLAEEYIWILLNYSILTTFCIPYPFLSPAFIGTYI